MWRNEGTIAIYPERYRLTEAQISERVGDYGFVEISDILRFLSFVCDVRLDECDYIYIRSKLGKCLSAHDDSSGYFVPLRELACELDCLVSRKLKEYL